MKGHRLHVRRKMKENNGRRRKTMENEENRGLINKKASEDQFMDHVQCNFGALIILSLSLSYSWILRVFLDQINIEVRRRKASKGRARKGKKSKVRSRKRRV